MRNIFPGDLLVWNDRNPVVKICVGRNVKEIKVFCMQSNTIQIEPIIGEWSKRPNYYIEPFHFRNGKLIAGPWTWDPGGPKKK